MKNIDLILATMLAATLSGCATKTDRCQDWPQCHMFTRESGKQGQPLSEQQALEIAKQEAKRHGAALADFNEPRGSYRDGEWFFLFEQIIPCLGCHFMVTVRERSDTTFYSPGR